MWIANFLFGRQGRFARIHWWAVLLFWGVVFMLVSKALGAVFPMAAQTCATQYTPGFTKTVCVTDWRLLVPWLCLTAAVSIPPMVKRLHDRGRPAYWGGVYLALAFLPLAAVSLAGAENLVRTSGMTAYLWIAAVVLALLAGLAAVIELGFLRGTNGPNAYGDEPALPGFDRAGPT